MFHKPKKKGQCKMFKNLKVSTKLVGGFFIVALIAGLIGYVGIQSAKKLNRLNNNLYTNNLVALDAIDNISLDMANMRLFVRTMQSANESEMKTQFAAFEEAKANFEKNIGIVEAAMTTPEARDMQRNLRTYFNQLVQYTNRVMAKTPDHKVVLDPEYREMIDATRVAALAAVKNADGLVELSQEHAQASHHESAATFKSIYTGLVLLVVFGALAGLFFGVFISRSVTKPLDRVVYMVSEIGKGHLSHRLNWDRGDEFGVLAKTMDKLNNDLQMIVIGLLNQIAEGNLSAEVVPMDPDDEMAPALRDTIVALRALTTEDGGKVLHAAAEKDLTLRMSKEYRGEYAKMKHNINAVVENLDDAIRQVSSAVGQVSNASGQITQGANALAQGANEQASSLEEISSSLEEISSMTKQNADNSNQAKILVTETGASINEANRAMTDMTDAIHRIKASSDNTAKILKTIDDIAFQTNLLALNAAVEAARAGEAGKGFAVVAEEVRNLAMRSAEAAKSTADMIEESVKNADSGVKITESVAQALEKAVQRSSKVNSLVAEVAAASSDQSRGIEQVNGAVAQMNVITQQNAANAEEAASAAEELNGQALELAHMVESFTLSSQNTAYEAAPKPMKARTPKTPTRTNLPAVRQTRANMPAVREKKGMPGSLILAPFMGTHAVGADEVIPLNDDEILGF